MTAWFLRLTHVTKQHPGGGGVENICVNVQPGESVVVLGPSGCGKTTLLRLIAGLERADFGEIWLDGRVVTAAGKIVVPPYQRGIGFVFQELALWPHLTIRDNLEFVMASAHVPKAEREAKASRVLGLVQVAHLASRYPHELSGGEQQRAALARALVGEARLVLLDEPLSSLDPDLRATLRHELSRLQGALGLTMIYVTHDREDAAVLADRVIEMRHGRIVDVQEGRRREAAL